MREDVGIGDVVTYSVSDPSRIGIIIADESRPGWCRILRVAWADGAREWETEGYLIVIAGSP